MHHSYRKWILASAVLGIAGHALAQITTSSVFTGGAETGGTSNYRIPGLVTAPDGSLLAFAEGRRNGSDPGAAGAPIDLVYKRSTNGGATWSTLGVLAHDNAYDFSDPLPIVDTLSGKIHLIFHRWPDNAGLSAVPAGTGSNSLNLMYTTSADNGATWSSVQNITTQVKDLSWKGLVLGPGSGIQLKWQTVPSRNGRLVAPAHLHGTTNFVVYSDDLGTGWTHGALAQTTLGGSNGNEAEIIETITGDLILNARQNSGTTRLMFRSTDGGATWAENFSGPAPVTTVDGSMIRYSSTLDGDDRNRILFSAPTGSTIGTGNSRDNLTVWTSYDEGRSFINPVQIVNGFSAYSVLNKQSDGRIGAIYEATGSTQIKYASFGLDVLESHPHPESLTHYDGFSNTIDKTAGGMGWSGKWTGTGTITTATASAFAGASSVPFVNFPFPTEPGRIDLAGQTSRRTLATPIDLDTSATTYVSVLVSRALDTSANDASQEFLDILLQDSTNTTQAAFGVGSSENFYVNALGDTVSTAGGAFDLTGMYFLLAKIVTKGAGAGNVDQMFVKAFKSGIDTIPQSDDGLGWTVVGTTTENSSSRLTQLVLSTGTSSNWSVDEIRVGTTYGAVASNAIVPEPGLASLVMAGMLLMLKRRR